ncbi:MAG: hypothetical protein J7641_19980 [Cyanobacteria bacterium SID2]|nr:hypothetical protein [Cyanobacteria bacterium SID2]
MALALVQFEANNGKTTRFRVDIGTANRFYAYAIGDDRTFEYNGLTFLENARFVSPLLGPLPVEKLGRTVLEIPSDRFDTRHRYLQLLSYRAPDKTGPALSDILTVPVRSTPIARSFSTETVAMENQPVDTVPFRYREVSYSDSLGLFSSIGKIVKKVASGAVKAVKTVAPAAIGLLGGGSLTSLAPVLTSFLGEQGAKSATGLLNTLLETGGNPEKIKSALGNEATLKQMADLISQLQTAPPPQSTNSTAKAMSFNGDSPIPGRVMMPPAVFDRLPTLMPLLSRSLHPETVRAIASNPIRARVLVGTISQGALDAGKHFPGFDRAIEDELRDRDPVNRPLRNGRNGSEPPYHRQERVRLQFSGIRPQVTGDRSRVLYRIDGDLAFPLMLDTPRPITRGTLQLFVKNPETLEVLVEKTYRLENVRSGELDAIPRLSQQQLRSLHPNEDYLICAVLTWTARSSRTGQTKRMGTSTAVLVSLVGEYFFDRIEGVEETVSLNDPQEYRPYWHKIWEGEFSEDEVSISLDCKYYYVLEPERANNARMETLISTNEGSVTERKVKLKTGLILSLNRLSELLNEVSSRSRLTEKELAALRCCEFKENFQQLARTRVEFEGYMGDRAALWVYPEIELRRVILKQALDSDANGRVLNLNEKTVYFPIPSIARFVGTSTSGQ